MIPPRQQHRPLGPENDLHKAILLSTCSINIDQGDPRGLTPLPPTTLRGFTPVVRILLNSTGPPCP